MKPETRDVVVVGGGVGGAAAALRAAQYSLNMTWILGDRESARASRGKYVHEIDNMIGVHPGVLASKLGKVLKDQPEALATIEESDLVVGTQDIVDNVIERIEAEFSERSELIADRAVSARRDGDEYVVTLPDGREIRAESVVLSTGVMDRQPPVKKELKSGKQLDGIKWVFPYANWGRLLYCIRCEGHMTRDTLTTVIGSTETTAQIAMMLHERYGVDVTLLTNGEEFEATERSRKLLEAYEIEVRGERIVDIYDIPPGEEPPATKGKKGTEMHGLVLENGDRVPSRFAMVAMGLYRVYNELAIELGAELEDSEAPTEERHVLIEDYSAETNVRGVFVVGDMGKRRDGGPLMKQVYTAQEYAVRAVDTIERRIRSRRRKQVLGEPLDA